MFDAAMIAPVKPDDRIEAIDVLRGFSLLGILLMNIVAFGMPFAAYTDPSAYGGASGANLAFWLTNQVLFEGKMRAIFSMLFGASMLIFVSRAEARGGGLEVADIYYRRTLWLVLIGLVHAYLIWYGDILFAYAVVGLGLFPFRKMSGRGLVILGASVLAFHSLMGIGAMFHFRDVAPRAQAAIAAEKSGAELTEEQKTAKEDWTKMTAMMKPDKAAIDKEIEAHLDGYAGPLKHRAGIVPDMQSGMLYRFIIWDVAGMLFLGVGLMKLGVFDASRSYRFYGSMAAIGYGFGIPFNYFMARQWIDTNFDLVAMFGYVMAPSDAGRFSVAAGHIALVMLMCKSGALGVVRRGLSNVGRMALSNYLLTSICMTTLFYGYGFGLFGKLERYQLLLPVAGMWTVNFVFSALWLRYFRFGPAEWMWRSLTYWEKQPMRLRHEAPASPAEEQAMPASA